MNNHHKLISLDGAPSLKYGDIFFAKNVFIVTNVYGQKISYGEVILHERTNDQIMLRWGEGGEVSSINDKCIF